MCSTSFKDPRSSIIVVESLGIRLSNEGREQKSLQRVECGRIKDIDIMCHEILYKLQS